VPLIHSKTPKAFKKNIETEMHHGKPQKQAVAIAYSEKRAAEHRKHAHGGKVDGCHLCMGGNYDDGGSVDKGPAIDPEKAKQFQKGFNAGDVSLADAYGNAKAALGFAEGGEVGVNKTIGIRGRSEAGAKLNPAFSTFGKEHDVENSKEEHRKTLGEMRGMKKPNLYADGGQVTADDISDEQAANSGYPPGPERKAYIADRQNRAAAGNPQAHGGMIGNSAANEKEPYKLAEGGEIEDGEDQEESEMHDIIGDELMDSLERKDKKGIMSALNAAIMECMNGRYK
jgi:hypothetical protein